MHFVFWQNILSPHQVPFMRCLADLGHDVTIVARDAMTADRLVLGWRVPDLGRVRSIINPSKQEAQQLIKGGSDRAIHIMAGARWTKLGKWAVQQCIASSRHLGVITEAPDARGIFGDCRLMKYRFERFTRGYHYDFVLAMGEMGVRWFRRSFYPHNRVFPFAYVTDSVTSPMVSESKRNPVLLFAGRFVRLKGLDLLLRALAAAQAPKANLHLIGVGPEKPSLERLAHDLGIHEQVAWLGGRDPERVQLEMGNADVTLLPSRKDGWGAVVNESLTVGTPVICSTACGAAELIRQPWLGTVFPSGHVAELARSLKHWIDAGPRSTIERERVRQWAERISSLAVAKYFIQVVEHVYSGSPCPTAPWRL